MIVLRIYLVLTWVVILMATSFVSISLIANRRKNNAKNVFKVLYKSFTDVRNYDNVDIVPEEEREQFVKDGKKQLSVYLAIVLFVMCLIPIFRFHFLKTLYDCCFMDEEELEEAINIIETTNKD